MPELLDSDAFNAPLVIRAMRTEGIFIDQLAVSAGAGWFWTWVSSWIFIFLLVKGEGLSEKPGGGWQHKGGAHKAGTKPRKPGGFSYSVNVFFFLILQTDLSASQVLWVETGRVPSISEPLHQAESQLRWDKTTQQNRQQAAPWLHLKCLKVWF